MIFGGDKVGGGGEGGPHTHSESQVTNLDKYTQAETDTLLVAKSDTGHGHSAGAIDDLTDVTITAPASGQVIKYDGSTWINDTDNTGGGGGDALTTNPLSQFAATTSAQLAGVLSDETGSGAAVFANSPTLVTPALGTPASGVATNLTGTASGLTAGNATQTNALKSATTTINVDAAAAPSSGQVLTATGESAATWQTPSGGGGGGSTTPRLEFVMGNNDNPLKDSGTFNGNVESVKSASTTIVYTSNAGVNITNGSATTDYGYIRAMDVRTGRWYATGFFDKNPSGTAVASIYFAGDADVNVLSIGSASGIIDGTSWQTMGFKITRVATVVTVYAVSGNAATQTATDVTTAATATTGWNTSGTNYNQVFHIELKSGTSAKFYINGTLVATHTTNLPTGDIVSTGQLHMQVHRISGNATTTGASVLGIQQSKVAIDMY